MELKRNSIFSTIFGIILIANFLILLDINIFFIRTLYLSSFIIFVPGLLILLALKIRRLIFWNYLVYIVGLSISSIMFLGLFINWILPILNISNKPLSLSSIIISLDLFLLALFIISYYRNKDLICKFKITPLDWGKRLFIIIPIIFPVLSVIGAFNLNNGGSNYLTIIMLGGIAVYSFIIIWFKDKLNKNIYIWAIFIISLSLLLMYSARSWNISGNDIGQEIYVFKLTSETELWKMSNFQDGYNACASLTVLPTVITKLADIHSLFVIRIIYSIIFSFVSIILFLIVNKYFEDHIAYLSVLFFVSQQPFFFWMPQLLRQEIALLFFSLLVLIIVQHDKIEKNLYFLLMIFSFSLIISHYSTSYIFLIVLLVYYLIYKMLLFKELKSGNTLRKSLNIAMVLIILIFSFFWYGQVTHISDSLVDFGKTSFNQILNSQVRSNSAQSASSLNPFKSRAIDYNSQILNYSLGIYQQYSNNPEMHLYDRTAYEGYKLRIIPTQYLTSKNNFLFNFIFLFNKILTFSIKILLIVGTIILFRHFRKNKLEYLDYPILAILFLLLILTLVFLPYISLRYNVERLYLQSLILLSLPLVLGLNFLLTIIRIKKIRFLLITSYIILILLFNTGFIYQIFGGGAPYANLNNFGFQSEQDIVPKHDVQSVIWLSAHTKNYDKIYVDKTSQRVIMAYGNRTRNLFTDLVPYVIDKDSYVYASTANLKGGKFFKSYNGITLIYNMATNFLNERKNIIYNNGGSKIFR